VSGHRAFAELTKDFTPERHSRVDEEYAKLRDRLLLYEPPDEKEQKRKMSGSILSYRSKTSPSFLKIDSQATSIRGWGKSVTRRSKILALRNRMLVTSAFDMERGGRRRSTKELVQATEDQSAVYRSFKAIPPSRTNRFK